VCARIADAPSAVLRDIFDALHRRGATEVAHADTLAWITQTCGDLPLTRARWVHIERHWAPASEVEDVILALEPGASVALSVESAGARDALHQWHLASSLHGSGLGRAWLEWDAARSAERARPTGVFVDTREVRGASHALACFERAVHPDVLAATSTVWARLRDVCPASQLLSVGCLWRSSDAEAPLRLCVRGAALSAVRSELADSSVVAALSQRVHAWPLQQEDAPICAMLHLDITSHGIQRAGVELVCNKAHQLHGTLREAAWLHAHAPLIGLPPAAGDSFSHVPAVCALTPEYLAVRRLNHLKCSVTAQGAWSVKSYVVHGALRRSGASIQ
jgi:hypothetical protein